MVGLISIIIIIVISFAMMMEGWEKYDSQKNINVIEADKNEGDERNILLHIGILSPFNDDPVIIIKQKGI